MSDHEVDRDVLLSRVIEGRATCADWRVLRHLASRDSQVWTELEELESINASLRRACEDAILSAERVDIESGVPTKIGGNMRLGGYRFGSVHSWGGWLAAAAVLLAWSLGMPLAGNSHDIQSGLGHNFVRIDSPDDALRTYVDRGREAGTVIGLVPDTQVIETRALPDGGGIEVVYVRQILERQQLRDLYRMIEDEAGNLVPTQSSLVQRARLSF